MAEKEGFEPSMGYKAHTPLAGERLRPLGHLSANLARMEGVEPPTAWFVARYSIQLSYMRIEFVQSLKTFGAHGRSRTSDRLVRSQVLYPAELHARFKKSVAVIGLPEMARMEGVEPPTAWFVARYSIQLSYMRGEKSGKQKKEVARMEGVEPPTAWFVARYSIQLSYMRELFSLLLKTKKVGAHGRSRTSDRLVRSQVLYPAELHAHTLIA
jgi:hypothetical protein